MNKRKRANLREIEKRKYKKEKKRKNKGET